MCESPDQQSGDRCISALRYPLRGAWARVARPPARRTAAAEARRWPARRGAARGARRRPRRSSQVSNWHEPTCAGAHGARRALASRTHHTKQEFRRQRGEPRPVVVRLCRDAHLATLAPCPWRLWHRPLAAFDSQRRTTCRDLHASVQSQSTERARRRGARAHRWRERPLARILRRRSAHAMRARSAGALAAQARRTGLSLARAAGEE
jgi:hypothetical protein